MTIPFSRNFPLGAGVTLLIISLILPSPAWAVLCTPANINLGTQAEVDEFQDLHGPGCDTIAGNLQLLQATDITNLDGLAGITRVNGNLFIGYADGLTSILGLAQLHTVEGDFLIESNVNLSTLSGLENLTTVGGRLELFWMHALVNIDPLSALQSTGDLFVHSNENLADIDGLAALESVQELSIEENRKLKNVDGLSGLGRVYGNLSIFGCRELTNIDGLVNLSRVDGSMRIVSNRELREVGALSSLVHIGGDLDVSSNLNLTHVDGFGSLNSVGGNLTVGGQANLVNINGFSSLKSVGGGIQIAGNTGLLNVGGLAGVKGDLLGGLEISHNNSLTSLAGLNGIKSLNGNLSISYNPSLTSMSGLSNLTHVQNHISIRGNSVLTHLDGLSGIAGVTGGLEVLENSALEDVDGLSGITHVSHNLLISNNAVLGNIDGLAAVAFVTNNLTISYNPNLKDLNGLVSLIFVAANVLIENNASLVSCRGAVALLDDIDDGNSGPGPGNGGVPDVGLDLTLANNQVGCNSREAILDSEAEATFQVGTEFSDGNPAGHVVELECDGSATRIVTIKSEASSNSPAEFEVSRFVPDYEPSCRAITTLTYDGYTRSASDCSNLPLTDGGTGSCTFMWEQLPIQIHVHKEFTNGNSSGVEISLQCEFGVVEVVDPTASQADSAKFIVRDFPFPGTDCRATEAAVPGYLQQSSSCDVLWIQPAYAVDCWIVNAPRPPKPDSPVAAMSGSWFDPASAGEGFMIHAVNDHSAVAYFYGYDDEGERLWLIATSSGPFEWDEGITFDAFEVAGGSFGSFDSKSIVETPWGTLKLTLEDCEAGTVALDGNDGTKTLSIIRLGQAAGSECAVDEFPQETDAVTGSWYEAATAGQGFAINKVSEERGVVYFYGFQDSGANLWLIGVWEEGFEFGSRMQIEMMRVSGGTFAEVHPDDINEEPWGTLHLEFYDCKSGKAVLQGLDGTQALGIRILAKTFGLDCE